MTHYTMDTDIFSLYLNRHPAAVRAVFRHLTDRLTLGVITVREVWDGLVAAIALAKSPDQIGAAHERLARTLNELRDWEVIGFPGPAVLRYADYRRQKLNVGANDLKIGAIVVEAGATVVTRNRVDFARIPGVYIVDWSV